MMKTKILRKMSVTIMLVAVMLAFSSIPAVNAADDDIKVLESYGKLPLSFIENKGQVNSDVSYYLNGRQGTIYFTKEAIVYDLLSVNTSHPKEETDPKDFKRLSFTLRPVGAEKDVQLIAEHKLPGKVNYLIGNDPEKWQTDIPIYKELIYKELYKGIDFKVYGTNNQMEYDFIVYPGADPNDIRMAFEGIDALSVNEEGNLVIKTAIGELKHLKPVIYQEIDGRRHTVAGSFAVAENTFGFDVGDYDKSRPLIIDPLTLSYSTYLGGNADDWGFGIAVDSDQHAYVTGRTCSTNFPTTTGVFQQAYGGSCDAFVTKLNPAGTALVYSTYLGGNGDDNVEGITVDSFQFAYVTGDTSSTNFPTTAGAFQQAHGGKYDAFVTRLGPAGSFLAYSTYLGGNGNEYSGGIAVDSDQHAYVTGYTYSQNFPTTAGAFQQAHGGEGYEDVFVTKLNPFGSGLVFSTYLGGNQYDGGGGIAVDSDQHVYVTGYTCSLNFPNTTGAFQQAHGGYVDAFLTKLNPAGSALVYSTYLGGNDGDYGMGIAVDSDQHAYMTGKTESSNFPTTAGAFQQAYGGGGLWSGDAFVTKLNPAGSALVYSTYLGGNGDEYSGGIAVDSFQFAYVTGSTYSTNFPTTAGAFQQAYGGGDDDAFMTKLNPAGSTLVYSTYLGGNGADRGYGIAIDSDQHAYITGWTALSNFPTTAGAFQQASGGNGDAFVTKFDADIDLIPDDPEFPRMMRPGKDHTINVPITNHGSQPTGSFNVALYVDDVLSSTDSVPGGLAGGASTTVDFDVDLPYGCYDFKVVADCDDQVGESNEDNNEVVRHYQVGYYIMVDGNDDFDALVAEAQAGWLPTGSVVLTGGTYYIQNLDIENCPDWGEKHGYGILIENTDVPFVIRDCTIHDCGVDGIHLRNLVDGKVNDSQ